MMRYDTAVTMGYVFGVKQPQVWTRTSDDTGFQVKQYCSQPEEKQCT